MADIYAATKALLAADATLTDITDFNGVIDDDDVGKEGLSRSDLQSGSTPRIVPTIYLNWTTSAPISRAPQVMKGASSGVQGVSEFLEVYFYENKGYSTIETMRRRVWVLLNQQRVSIDTDYLYNFIWRGDVKRRKDERLGDIPMERSRFEGVMIRRF